jgi:hypothetical protein
MYHLELRQFPHNTCCFNLDERELRAVLEPWVREKFVALGERKWSPHQAKLTILEGPRLEVAQLTMGRGWRAAERGSEDVTERLLAAAKSALSATAGASSQSASAEPGPLADPLGLGVQLASLLGEDAARLLEAWRALAAASPGLAPSKSLALAELEIKGSGGDPG